MSMNQLANWNPPITEIQPMMAARRADTALRDRYSELGTPRVEDMSWEDYDELISAILSGIDNWPPLYSFHYQHPSQLQDPVVGIGKTYSVPLAYSDLGGEGEPMIAIGGLTNVVQRFDFLALDAMPAVRIIGLDLAGRGRSGWMSELFDYNLETYVEQLTQFMDFLALDSCTLLGSSLGGSTAIRFAARNPDRVRRIVLNDSCPYIPLTRRARRSISVARHYVFHNPAEMFRRTGAAAKHEGPATDAVLLHSAHNKTCWSENENGRIYRHDLRAMLAYRAEADNSLDLWNEWNQLRCPVLLLHGTQSDSTTNETVDRMRNHDNISVIHVEDTGHTPALVDGALTRMMVAWILDDQRFDEDKVFHVDYNPVRVLFPDDRR